MYAILLAAKIAELYLTQRELCRLNHRYVYVKKCISCSLHTFIRYRFIGSVLMMMMIGTVLIFDTLFINNVSKINNDQSGAGHSPTCCYDRKIYILPHDSPGGNR